MPDNILVIFVNFIQNFLTNLHELSNLLYNISLSERKFRVFSWASCMNLDSIFSNNQQFLSVPYIYANVGKFFHLCFAKVTAHSKNSDNNAKLLTTITNFWQQCQISDNSTKFPWKILCWYFFPQPCLWET